MTSPLRYRAVLFDLDGTLVDSYAALADAINHVRRAHGLTDLHESAIRGFVGYGIERLLSSAFGTNEVPDGVQAAFEQRYDEICCEQSYLLADVEATISALDELGIVMAVCTNKPTSFSRKILESLQLAPYFRAIVGPDLAGARKPAAQHLLTTLASTDCAERDALFVGDMPVDVEAARNSGIDVAVVSSGSSSAQDLRAAQPDHYLDHFSDLLHIVRHGVIA